MSAKRKIVVPGYDSVRQAVDAYGVTVQTIRRHMHMYGDLSRLEKARQAKLTPDPVAMPDGSNAANYTEAAVRLGVTEGCIRHHMHQHGNLLLVGRDRRVRTMEGNDAKRRIRLSELPGVAVDFADPRPETAPWRGLLASSPRTATPRVDVEAVVETIRQCRDEFLTGRDRQGAAV